MNIANLTNHFKQVNQNNHLLQAEREQSFERFAELGLPQRSLEDWRYSDLKKIKNLELINETVAEFKVANADKEFSFPVNQLVFKNGMYDQEASTLSDGFKDKVSVTEAQVFSSLGSESEFASNSFYHLNQSFNSQPYKIEVADGAFLKAPIVLTYKYEFSAGSMCHPQVNINVGKNSQVKIIEHHEFNGVHKDSSLINTFTQLNCAQNSLVKMLRVSEFTNSQVFQTGQFVADLWKEAHLDFTSVNLGGAFNRLECEMNHREERAELHVKGLYFAKGDEQVNMLARIFHAKGMGESHQLYKGVLSGKAKSVFDGMIHIAKDAQKVDSSQMNKNLILSDEAEVYTKPQLNINADDVKAAHGATVSQLSDEEIFYLMSRGIAKDKAKSIIQKAFVDEIVLSIGDLNIRNWLKQKVDQL